MKKNPTKQKKYKQKPSKKKKPAKKPRYFACPAYLNHLLSQELLLFFCCQIA